MKCKRSWIIIDLILIISLISIFTGINKTTYVAGSKIEEHPIYSVDINDKSVSLTFDINWTQKDNTQVILDVLNKYNIKATFFIMGGWVDYNEENQNILKKIKEGGHEIGNHSYKHPSFTKIGGDRITEEIEKTNDVIKKITGDKPKLVRFPSGDYNKQVNSWVRDLGYITIQWDVDSVDWKEKDPKEEFNRVMKNTKNGSIILFHNAKNTPDNLIKIISSLKNQGYEFKTVGDLIYDGDYFIDEQGIQHKINSNIV